MEENKDCEIFIFNINQEKSQINYTFIDKTELFISTSEVSKPNIEMNRKQVWNGTLNKGIYVLIPSTTGKIIFTFEIVF